jgi:hypothetical protein
MRFEQTRPQRRGHKLGQQRNLAPEKQLTAAFGAFGHGGSPEIKITVWGLR